MGQSAERLAQGRLGGPAQCPDLEPRPGAPAWRCRIASLGVTPRSVTLRVYVFTAGVPFPSPLRLHRGGALHASPGAARRRARRAIRNRSAR